MCNRGNLVHFFFHLACAEIFPKPVRAFAFHLLTLQFKLSMTHIQWLCSVPLRSLRSEALQGWHATVFWHLHRFLTIWQATIVNKKFFIDMPYDSILSAALHGSTSLVPSLVMY
jgi:hypothetical protein